MSFFHVLLQIPFGARAAEFLSRNDLKNFQRAEAERVRACCRLENGEPAFAIPACDRALSESDLPQQLRNQIYRVRGRAFIIKRDGEGAVSNYALALAEVTKLSGGQLRWACEKELIDDLRASVRDYVRDAAEKAVRNKPESGVLWVMVAIERPEASPSSVEAWEKACEFLKADPVFLVERVLAACGALEVEKAIAARAEFLPLYKPHDSVFMQLRIPSLGLLTGRIVDACKNRNDVARAYSFVRALAGEPLSWDSLSPIGALLKFIADEKLIEEVEQTLVRGARDEWQRLYALYPGAYAYDSMGRPEKAIARYRDIAEGKGVWTDGSREAARYYIRLWEKSAKFQMGLLAARRLAEFALRLGRW